MKTILTTILLIVALLTAGAAMGEIDVTLETYDRDNDGVIDEVERLTLDIDIENGRIRVSESMFEGGYTITGSLILNDEFKEFAFGGEQTTGYAVVEDPIPSGEPKTIAPPPPDPEPEQTPAPPPTPEDDDDPAVITYTPPPSGTTAILGGGAIVLLIAAGVYLYYRKDRPEKDKPEDE